MRYWTVACLLLLGCGTPTHTYTSDYDERIAKLEAEEAHIQKEIERRHWEVDKTITISLEEYRAIPLGATYKEVATHIGRGKRVSMSRIGGQLHESYQWINPDGSAVIMFFSDGKLLNKTQSGLKPEPPPVIEASMELAFLVWCLVIIVVVWVYGKINE